MTKKTEKERGGKGDGLKGRERKSEKELKPDFDSRFWGNKNPCPLH